MSAILAINTGSSSIKLAAFIQGADGSLERVLTGLLDEHQAKPRLRITDPSGATVFDCQRHAIDALDDSLLCAAVDWMAEHLPGSQELAVVGHRIVHGGADLTGPVRLTIEAVDKLERLSPLAPLHQPRSLAPVRSLMHSRPALTQIGCFDTSFHQTLSPTARRFALPWELHDKGLRRFGFHGLSFESIAHQLRVRAPESLRLRTVIAHLGNGASLCALQEGVSIDTTMGMTPLDGLVMGTRCGAIDPGILLYLLKTNAFDATDLEELLYRESGLLGVSGESADMRDLLSSSRPEASEAVSLFCERAAKEIAAMAVSLGGLDRIVFTGGIGENSPAVRAMVCGKLAWLGLAMNRERNEHGDMIISAADSRIELLVLSSDEDAAIARQCQTLT